MVGVQGSSDPNRELLDAQALVGHLVPAGTVYAFLAEHRQRLFPDELFADLFGSGRGRPSVPAEVIATVLVLQSLEVCRIVKRSRQCAPICDGRPLQVGPWTTKGSIRPC